MSDLAQELEQALASQPLFFAELLAAFPQVDYREFLRAWGELRESDVLARNAEGRYILKPDGQVGGATGGRTFING